MTVEGEAWRRRSPRAHWILLGLVVLAIGATLVVSGYTSGDTGTGTGNPTDMAPAGEPFTSAGPVLDLRGGEVQSVATPPKTVVLTFDDGPDPEWTPAVLDVLARHGVRATFFVLGHAVTAHPDLVRAEIDAGHEVGAHTYNHPDLSTLPAWRVNLELSLSQSVLAGATGRHVGLFRPPYSSTPAALDVGDVEVLQQVADRGYLTVVADLDSGDWRRPGIDQIVADATPAGDAGAIVLFHDGGGDRAQTVAAVDRLISDLQGRGYEFATVGELLDGGDGAVMAEVGARQKWQGRVAIAVIKASQAATRLLALSLVPIALLAVARAVIVVHEVRRVRRRRVGVAEGPVQSVSVVVPAYNEEAGIGATVRSLLAATQSDVEIVVVDDGSTDDTAAIVGQFAAEGVRLVRQPNRGKAAALAAGIGATESDLIVTADGDTIFEPGAIAALVAPFADARVGAVSGNTKVGNRSGVVGRWQHIEYVMGFNLDRRMYEGLECMPTVPGAVGAFRRRAVEAGGGPSDDTLAEDTDLTIAIQRAGWRVVYAQAAVAWTEAPASLGGLWRQRYRWCYGTLQAIWKHRAALRDRSSPLGRRGLPYLIAFQVLLPILAPLLDLYTLYAIVFLNPWPVLAYWVGFAALQLGIAVYAFRLDGESLRPLWALALQQFVYRQLMYLVVIQSMIRAAVGIALPWQRIERSGTAGEAIPVR
ncbi:MAG TPA: bifunctional polysaccharide deacetylase/glycosyltransferase family 2 protein [Acidimicrobiales bacterium]